MTGSSWIDAWTSLVLLLGMGMGMGTGIGMGDEVVTPYLDWLT